MKSLFSALQSAAGRCLVVIAGCPGCRTVNGIESATPFMLFEPQRTEWRQAALQ